MVLVAQPSTRQGILGNEGTLCWDRPCLGGFETRPYENQHVNHFPGTAAPQCGKPETVTVPGTKTTPEIAGFPGTLEDHHRHDVREAGLNSLWQHVTEHPAGGSLAAGWPVTRLK